MPAKADAGQQGPSAGDGDSIKVFVRVRPPATPECEFDHGTCLDVDNGNNAIIMHSKPDPKVFTFDQVADIHTTQETVFTSVGKKSIESCLAGYNCTIFAYGQTGSGKTFTMLGPADDAENFQHELRGIIPRTFEYLFNHITRQKELEGDNVQFLCRCSFMEIYNEQVYDLLDAATRALQLRENIKRGVFVDGIIEQTVNSAAEAYETLSVGQMNRTVASTSMNRESSRSHGVFTLSIESKVNRNGVWNVKSSQLNLVDLAGSERQKDTNTVGQRLKEGCSINKSLSALGNVIMALVDTARGKTRHVPYRDSKLTFLIRDSLGGNALTFMIACVHPGSRCFGETLSTLQFARRAKMIKNKAVVNEDAQGNVSMLQAEIRRLKEALSQYQQGQIPTEPSAFVNSDGDQGCDSIVSSSGSDLQWRRCFLQAMAFRQQAIQQLEMWKDKCKGLEKTVDARDKALQQKQMVLKFRQETIKKLEKSIKEKESGFTEEKDAIIENMKVELQAATAINEYHPEVAKLNYINKKLSAELSSLKNSATIIETTEKNKTLQTKLESTFTELQQEQPDSDGDKKKMQYTTPQQTAEAGPAVATVERQKSQISKLQAEIETVKRELSTEREQYQKTKMDQEAELASLKKLKEEYERLLKAHHISAQADRQAANEMHMETIKTMTTPKKAKYQLRNRTVLVPSSGTPGVPGGPPESSDSPVGRLSFTHTEEDLMSETMPPEMIEEKTEALTEEIRKLQEENSYLKTQHENRESHVLSLVEESSKLESQKGQLEQLLERERDQWKTIKTDVDEKLSAVEKLNAELQHTVNVLEGEVRDWRVVSESAEKQLKDQKKSTKTQSDEKDKEVANMQNKLLQLEQSVSKIQKDLDSVTEEKEHMEDALENVQAQLSFQEERLRETSDILVKTNEALKQERQNVETLSAELEEERERTRQLNSQMQEEGSKQQQELVEALNRQQELVEEIREKRSCIEALEETKKVQESDYKKLQSEFETIDKRNKDLVESNNRFRATVEEVRVKCESEVEKQEVLERQLGEALSKLQDLEDQAATVQNTHETEVKQLKELLDSKCNEMQQLQCQLDMLQDDLDEYVKEDEKHKIEIDRLTQEKAKGLEDLQAVTSEKNRTMEEWSHQREQLKADIAALQQGEGALEKQMQQKVKECDDWREKCSRMQTLLTDLEASLQEKNKSITVLETVKEEFLKQKEICETKNERITHLEYEMLNLQKEVDVSNSEKESCRKDCDDYKDRLDKSTQQCLILTKMKEDLSKELSEISHQKEEHNRLLELIQKDEEDMKELRSKIAQLEEINSRLTKEKENAINEAAHLAGHQNHHQKIHYMERLKQANIELTERNEQLRLRSVQLEKELDKHKIDIPLVGPSPAKRVKTATPSKVLTPSRKGNCNN